MPRRYSARRARMVVGTARGSQPGSTVARPRVRRRSLAEPLLACGLDYRGVDASQADGRGRARSLGDARCELGDVRRTRRPSRSTATTCFRVAATSCPTGARSSSASPRYTASKLVFDFDPRVQPARSRSSDDLRAAGCATVELQPVPDARSALAVPRAVQALLFRARAAARLARADSRPLPAARQRFGLNERAELHAELAATAGRRSRTAARACSSVTPARQPAAAR